MNAIDRLIKQIKAKNNPSVMGLDPRIEHIPEFIKAEAFNKYGKNLKGAAQAVLEFNKRLIDSTSDLIPVIKPQIAFYEVFGEEGIKVFKETCEYGKAKGLIVIGDVKRGDIGSTAEAYSTAYLGRSRIEAKEEPVFDLDFITVSPFLGEDSIMPFLDKCIKYNKGIFLLVKTSNKSSGDIQDLLTFSGKFLYEHIAELVNKWGEQLIGEHGYSAIGAVVGATYPEQIKSLRNIMNKAYILVPGYGAQGGTAKDVMNSFNEDGLGAVISASRSISLAFASERWKQIYSEEKFDEAARAEVMRMRDELNKEIKKQTEG